VGNGNNEELVTASHGEIIDGKGGAALKFGRAVSLYRRMILAPPCSQLQLFVKSSLESGLGSNLSNLFVPPPTAVGILGWCTNPADFGGTTGATGSIIGRGAVAGVAAAEEDFHPQRLEKPCRDNLDPAVEGVAAVLGVLRAVALSGITPISEV